MLERFKVPPEDEKRVHHEALLETVTAIFEKMGCTPEDAAQGADVLVSTDLRGVETHGVSNMLRRYVEAYNSGHMKPRPDWKIIKESPATATLDADNGLGIMICPKAMKIAIEKARNVGIGAVTMYNAGHSGAIGHHAMMAAKEDMVGLAMTAAGLQVVPTFGAEGRLGTNPIAIAAPAKDEAFFLFDAATSAIAGNKLGLAERIGATLLPGWVAELDGSPIMNEIPVRKRNEYYQLPLGSTREMSSHKGYGFALMPEILATLLAGMLPPMVAGRGMGGVGSRHFVAAYNIAAFTDVDGFKEHMDAMLKSLRETKPAPGHERVLYPGLAESEEENDRRANGIPLHKEVIQWFEDITSELSIPRLKTV